jgi:hypothetical protein
MKYFYESDFDDYINDENGEKRIFNKRNCYMFIADDDNDSIITVDSNNHVPPIEELKTIILGLIRFINTNNQENVDKYNLLVDEKSKKQEEVLVRRIETKQRERPGYVYFICDNMDNVKIGLSKDIDSRFKTYTEMPYNPEIIHLLKCSDMVKVEEFFHNKFSSKRFKGEWFKLDDKDIKYIKARRYSEEIMKCIV